ncbi:MAG: hypothetical protein WBN19_02535, partial [Lutimonas sp.]
MSDLKVITICFFFLIFELIAQEGQYKLIKAGQIFDGNVFHSNKVVLVQGEKIIAFDEESKISIPVNCEVLNYPNGTLMPGMIEGHAHLLLHPYNETSWNDQVLKESHAERAIR